MGIQYPTFNIHKRILLAIRSWGCQGGIQHLTSGFQPKNSNTLYRVATQCSRSTNSSKFTLGSDSGISSPVSSLNFCLATGSLLVWALDRVLLRASRPDVDDMMITHPQSECSHKNREMMRMLIYNRTNVNTCFIYQTTIDATLNIKHSDASTQFIYFCVQSFTKKKRTNIVHIQKIDISIHMSHVQESERAVQYVIRKGAICRGIAMTCATKARCRLMIPICSPNLWPPMESLGGAALVWKKRHQTKVLEPVHAQYCKIIMK